MRVDTGISAGDVIGGNFDSLLAKVIIVGETRAEALERARRALDEMVVEGMATALPFHRLVIRDEAFTAEPFTVHTRWIETEWDNTVPAVHRHRRAPPTSRPSARPSWSRWAASGWRSSSPPGSARVRRQPRPPRRSRPAGAAEARRAPRSAATRSPRPMQGTIVKIAVADGDEVAEGDLVVVLEAMKMEQPLHAHKAGTVSGLAAEVGAVITSGAAICTIA